MNAVQPVLIRRGCPVKYSRERIKMLYSVHHNVAKVADIVGCSIYTVYLALRK